MSQVTEIVKRPMQNRKMSKGNSHKSFSNKTQARMAGDTYLVGSGEGRTVTFRNIATDCDINNLDFI